MRAVRTNAIRSRLSALSRVLLASLAGLWAIAGLMASNVLAADEPRAPLQIQFSLDRPIDAAAAPFVMASAGGLFGAEALAVTTNIASGSSDAIARVAAGTSDFALVDINALMRFRDKDKQGGPKIKAVFVLFNKAPYSIIARKSRGIRALTDHRGQDARRRRRRPVDPAVAGGGKPERHQAQERKAEQHQRRGARADAVGRPDRCRDRILLSCRRSISGIAACRPTIWRC